MAAWVLIPNNDKSSLIHHMGSKKGTEFVKSKPDINTELHLFLQNYKKKGKFKVFSSSEIYNFGDYENLLYYENNDTINMKNNEIIKQI